MWTISFSYRELILSVYCSHRSALFPVMSFVSWYRHSGARVSQVNLASHYISESHPHSCRHLVRGHIQLNTLSCGQVTSWFSGGTSRFCRHRWQRSCGSWEKSRCWVARMSPICTGVVHFSLGCFTVVPPSLFLLLLFLRHWALQVPWKKTLYRKSEPHKPKFLAKQHQDSSIAAIPRSWAARNKETLGQQRLSQFVCWHEGR